MKTDVGVATTGIAGPGGGNERNPVGNVWIAVCTPETTICQLHQFPNLQREEVICKAALTAIRITESLLES